MKSKTIDLHNLKLYLFQEDELYSLMKKSFLQKEKTSIFYCDFRLLNYSFQKSLNFISKNIYCYPDSTGVYIILKLLLPRIFPRFKKLISTDIYIELLKIANDNNLSLFLLGNENEILQLFIYQVSHDYPNIKFVGSVNGYGNLTNSVVEKINDCHPDILLVGMGVPKQELWVIENYNKLNANLIITVGAFFSLYSGHIRRAPKLLRTLSLEWLVRLINDPARLWKRYFVEYPFFVFNVIKERITK